MISSKNKEISAINKFCLYSRVIHFLIIKYDFFELYNMEDSKIIRHQTLTLGN